MRQTDHRLFERIAERDNLRLALWKALKGKRASAEARAFQGEAEANLQALRAGLLSRTLTVGRSTQFTIFDPKERRITAPCFAERVLHHGIMNVCEPVFDRWLIADTYACRAGKGRIAAVLRARQFARRHRSFLKLDIRKYFDSVPHARLLELLERRFKERALLDLFARIVGAHCVTPGRGLPIGSLTSQHLANFYLGWLDRFAKECLRLPGYVRYMDDIAGWSNDSQKLKVALPRIVTFLADFLGLAPKPEPYLNRTAHGMDFLGSRIFPTHVALNRRGRRRFALRLAALETSCRVGELTEAELQTRATALVAFARSAGMKSWRCRRRAIDQATAGGQ